jgi:predicted PurR-regulated permease PerM
MLLASANIGLAVLQWILSILLAGALLAHFSGGTKIADSLARRLFGEKGAELEELAGNTIRSVTNGIIGVAFIQSILAAAGFWVARLPGAGLWSAVFLAAAVLQVGTLVLIPAVVYMFAIASTTKAILFLIWCLFVGVLDNVLKPLLLGRGIPVPMIVVFLGAIGGFIAMGIIGLFVGAVVLCVGYKLFMAWLEGAGQGDRETGNAVHLVASGTG